MVKQPRKLAFSDADQALMGREIATPTVGGVRSILDAHPAQGLDPARLTRILRAAEEGDAISQHELAEEIEEKDPHYLGVMGARKRAVAQQEITVNAASDDDDFDQQAAQVVRDWLDRDTLEDELFDMLDAIGKSYSVTEVVWDVTTPQWLPKCLERADQRFFEFDRFDGKTLRLKGGVSGTQGMPEDLTPYKYIVHQHPAKSGLPIRGGLVRTIAWIYLFKNIALKDWTIFAEVYGMPIRVGKYQPNATEEERRILLRAVQSIGADAAAIIPSSMIIDFVDGAAANNPAVYKDLLTYLDDQTSKAVLGQTGTTDAKAGGLGSGSADVHNDVRGDIMRADGKKLAATLNATLVKWIVDFNLGPPPSGNYPRIRIGQSEQFGEAEMGLVKDFVAMGGEVEQSVIRDKIGLPDPPEKLKDGKPPKLLRPANTIAPTLSETISAQTPPNPSDAPPVAASATLPSYTALNPPYAHLKVTASPSVGAGDAIDAAVDDLGDAWETISAPVLDPIEAALAASSDYADFRERLTGLMTSMDPASFSERLAMSMFAARLAGESATKLNGEG